MPLTKAGMAAKIKTKIAAVAPAQIAGAGSSDAYRTAVLEAMCDGIIEEIVQNALVTVASVSGVTAGAANSGPGTGTIT